MKQVVSASTAAEKKKKGDMENWGSQVCEKGGHGGDKDTAR
jgi:hypothetical protein